MNNFSVSIDGLAYKNVEIYNLFDYSAKLTFYINFSKIFLRAYLQCS